MRFDDSLETVLTADMSTPFGAQAAWRQLVDLIGRGRAPASEHAIAQLRAIRPIVPAPVRAASSRALAFACPPAPLVALFAEEDLVIAAPLLRAAALEEHEWVGMLPNMTPGGRSVLRHRRDLQPGVVRALETFGPIDFILPISDATDLVAAAPDDAGVESFSIDWTTVIDSRPGPAAVAPLPAPIIAETPAPSQPQPAVEPNPDQSFVSFASVAFGLPVVMNALRQQDGVGDEPEHAADDAPLPVAALGAPLPLQPDARADPPVVANDTEQPMPRGPFQISDLVARIDAFQRQREESSAIGGVSRQNGAQLQFGAVPEGFQFETDTAGIIRWVAGVSRATIIGISLDGNGRPGGPQVDGVASGAFRRRAGFANARLLIDGEAEASGQWRISGVPAFDRASGRFTGFRGTARRPRPDERAEPEDANRTPASDAVRQLVHELRTPTTAIAGFAEMIEGQLLGPVPSAYRDYASAIRGQAAGLLGAIDDLDMAARIEAHALDLRPVAVSLAPLLNRICHDLAPLARLRGAALELIDVDEAAMVHGDDRAMDRLLSRLLAAIMSASDRDEVIAVRLGSEGEETIALHINRPRALAAYSGDAVLAIDAETEAEAEGAPLLGTGFALRLARNLAVELGGSLTIGVDRLTLRLPTVFSEGMGQASTL